CLGRIGNVPGSGRTRPAEFPRPVLNNNRVLWMLPHPSHKPGDPTRLGDQQIVEKELLAPGDIENPRFGAARGREQQFEGRHAGGRGRTGLQKISALHLASTPDISVSSRQSLSRFDPRRPAGPPWIWRTASPDLIGPRPAPGLEMLRPRFQLIPES